MTTLTLSQIENTLTKNGYKIQTLDEQEYALEIIIRSDIASFTLLLSGNYKSTFKNDSELLEVVSHEMKRKENQLTKFNSSDDALASLFN